MFTRMDETGTIFDLPLPMVLMGIGITAVIAVIAYLNMRRHK